MSEIALDELITMARVMRVDNLSVKEAAVLLDNELAFTDQVVAIAQVVSSGVEVIFNSEQSTVRFTDATGTIQMTPSGIYSYSAECGKGMKLIRFHFNQDAAGIFHSGCMENCCGW